MPMRYANESDVLSQLRLNTSDADYARLVRLENGLCDVFDHKVGRSFGVAPVAETRTIVVGRDWWANTFGVEPYLWWGTSQTGPAPIIADVPLRSVTSVVTGGTWDGAAWTDTTALASDEYRLTYTTPDGLSYGIEAVSGHWSGTVHITGIWGDQDTADVPNDVREALTFLAVDEWHIRNSAPTNAIGPEGFAIGTRNAWNLEAVKTAIDRHSVVTVLV